jgi:glycerol-3-phosphate dehydrogenase
VPAHTVSATSREHEILIEPDGLLTIVGGKLTTYRRMAEEAVDRIVELSRDRGYEDAVAPCSTGRRPLPGGDADPARVSLGEVELAPDVERHLRQAYGSRAGRVVACMSELWSQSQRARSAPRTLVDLPAMTLVDLSARIDPDLPYLWAEVLHSARHELVTEVEDVLRRRIPLFRDARDQGMGVVARAASVVGDVLGWSAERRSQSVDAYTESVATSRAWISTKAPRK